MATATVTVMPNGSYLVPIKDSLAQRVQFLQVLVAKIKYAAVKAVKSAIKFGRRVWDAIASNAKGGIGLAMITATKTGYTALAGVVKGVLSFITRNFGKVVRAVHNGIDKIGYTIASYVGMFSKKAGSFLANANSKFTDVRWSAYTYIAKNSSVFGEFTQQAYNSNLTVRATTIGSATIATGMLVPAVGSWLTKLPFIGKALAFALTGGISTILSITAIATAGAILTIGNAKLKPVLKAKFEPAMRVLKNRSIVTQMSEDGTVVVEGATSIEEAQQIANAHAEQDVKLLEGLLRGSKNRR